MKVFVAIYKKNHFCAKSDNKIMQNWIFGSSMTYKYKV